MIMASYNFDPSYIPGSMNTSSLAVTLAVV